MHASVSFGLTTVVAGVPWEAIRIIVFGRSTEDGRTLADYNVQRESTIHFVRDHVIDDVDG